MLRRSIAFAVLLATAPCQAADLKMRFVYGGDPPEPKPIEIRADKSYFADKGIVDESLLVNKKNGGIANVVVYLYTGRRAVLPPKIPHEPRSVVLTAKDGRFTPRIAVARVGDTIQVNNEDEVGHNFNFSFFKNPAYCPAIPAGKPFRRLIEYSEPAPVPVACNIHPWPRAYLLCVDHPYVGVSDENGDLTIKDLPQEMDLTFRVFHESLGKSESFIVHDEPVQWPRKRFTQRFTSDVHDMGIVKLTPSQFVQ